MESPKISLVIPFFNDQDRLMNRLPEVKSFFEMRKIDSFEVILVDDGSVENRSAEIEERFAWVKVLRYFPNRGKGYAVRAGMMVAKGEFRFFTDADIPFGMEPIETAMTYLEDRNFDLVIGDRGLPESVYHIRQSLLRRYASRLFTFFISRIVVTGVKDTQCGFKGFRAPIAEFIFSRARLDGFAFDVEIVYIAFKHNFILRRIPMVLKHAEQSTLRLHWDSWVMLYEVFKIKWNHLRGYYR